MGRAQYENDELNGDYIEWYENGITKSVGAMKNGKAEGQWRAWLEDGTPDKDLTGMYQDGQKIR